MYKQKKEASKEFTVSSGEPECISKGFSKIGMLDAESFSGESSLAKKSKAIQGSTLIWKGNRRCRAAEFAVRSMAKEKTAKGPGMLQNNQLSSWNRQSAGNYLCITFIIRSMYNT